MPTPQTPLIPNNYYHIVSHANGFENIFQEDRNYEFFLDKIYQYIKPSADILAYCLLPNHFHILIKTKSEEELLQLEPKLNLVDIPEIQKMDLISRFLSQQISNCLNSYCQAFNKLYSRKGSIFRSNFFRKHIEDEDYLRNVILYIHKNPIKHGFTYNPADWKFSSWSMYDTDVKNDLLASSIVLELFENSSQMKLVHQFADQYLRSTTSSYEKFEYQFSRSAAKK